MVEARTIFRQCSGNAERLEVQELKENSHHFCRDQHKTAIGTVSKGHFISVCYSVPPAEYTVKGFYFILTHDF